MHGTSTINPGSTTLTTPVSSPWSWQELRSSIRSDLVLPIFQKKNKHWAKCIFLPSHRHIIHVFSPPCVRVFVVLRLSVLLRDAPGHQGHGGRVHKLRGHSHELPGLSHHPQTTHKGQWRSVQSGCAQLSKLCIALWHQCIYIFAHLALPLLKLTYPIFHTNNKSKTHDRIGV